MILLTVFNFLLGLGLCSRYLDPSLSIPCVVNILTELPGAQCYPSYCAGAASSRNFSVYRVNLLGLRIPYPDSGLLHHIQRYRVVTAARGYRSV